MDALHPAPHPLEPHPYEHGTQLPEGTDSHQCPMRRYTHTGTHRCRSPCGLGCRCGLGCASARASSSTCLRPERHMAAQGNASHQYPIPIPAAFNACRWHAWRAPMQQASGARCNARTRYRLPWGSGCWSGGHWEWRTWMRRAWGMAMESQCPSRCLQEGGGRGGVPRPNAAHLDPLPQAMAPAGQTRRAVGGQCAAVSSAGLPWA